MLESLERVSGSTLTPPTARQLQITDLVECCHEAGVVVEGRHDQGVVLLMDVQGRLDVNFGVLEETHTMNKASSSYCLQAAHEPNTLEEVWYLLLSRHVKVNQFKSLMEVRNWSVR